MHGRSMFIIGHRGAGGLEPENTLRALRRGIECADFVEVDLRLARDGIPVAIHDATLDRTTDGTGPVKDYTIEELKGLDAGEGETVPAFQEILKLICDHGAGLVVEIKEPGTEAIIVSALMDRMPDRLILTSLYSESVAMAKKLLPGVQAGLIYLEPLDDPVGLAHQIQAEIILPWWGLIDREVVERAQGEGLLVIPWTLDAPDEIQEAVRLGVDGFAADDPCTARRYLRSAGTDRA